MAAVGRAGATSAKPIAFSCATGGSGIAGRSGCVTGALLFLIAASSSRTTAAGAAATSAAFSRVSRGSLCFAESDVPAVCDPKSALLPAAAFAFCRSSVGATGNCGALATAGSSAEGRMSGRSTATRNTIPRPNTTLAAKASGAPHLRRIRDIRQVTLGLSTRGANFLHHGFGGVARSAGVDGNRGAGGRESQRGCTTDVHACAGDERDFAGEFLTRSR